MATMEELRAELGAASIELKQLSDKCDAQAAVIERVRALVALFDGHLVPRARLIEALAAAPEHTAPKANEPGAPHDLLKQVEQARRDLSAATARIAELERALTGREARYVQAQEDRNAANDRAEAAESTCKALRNELSRDMTASGEAEAVSLRAEVDRLRDERDEAEEHKRQADTSKLEERKLRIKADRSLAAATALLRQVHADQAPTVSLLCAIGDHLDDQAPTRREAERG
jgi:chromosome segregation ATPase